MKKLKTHRYLLVTVMGLLVACTSYTSTDEWPNPRPNSNPDTTTPYNTNNSKKQYISH